MYRYMYAAPSPIVFARRESDRGISLVYSGGVSQRPLSRPGLGGGGVRPSSPTSSISRQFGHFSYMLPSSSSATTSSASLPHDMVLVLVVVAVTVAEAVERLDQKLFMAVKETLEGIASAPRRTVLQWPMRLAVRAQLSLRAASDPVAELLGRTIDAALESRAKGVPFRHWATPPLSSCWSPSTEAEEVSHIRNLRSATPGQLALGFEMPESRALEREHTENSIPIPSDSRE